MLDPALEFEDPVFFYTEPDVGGPEDIPGIGGEVRG